MCVIKILYMRLLPLAALRRDREQVTLIRHKSFLQGLVLAWALMHVQSSPMLALDCPMWLAPFTSCWHCKCPPAAHPLHLAHLSHTSTLVHNF